MKSFCASQRDMNSFWHLFVFFLEQRENLAFYDWVIGVSSLNVLKNMFIICYCLKTHSFDYNYEAIEVNVPEKSF